MGQFDKCYGAVEEGVTNSVCLDGMLHKGDDICANNLCAGKAETVFLAEETLCAEAWRFKEMCWWEGVADEARMMKGSERLGIRPLPLGDGGVSPKNWSDLHFRSNILVSCIKEKRG